MNYSFYNVQNPITHSDDQKSTRASPPPLLKPQKNVTKRGLCHPLLWNNIGETQLARDRLTQAMVLEASLHPWLCGSAISAPWPAKHHGREHAAQPGCVLMAAANKRGYGAGTPFKDKSPATYFPQVWGQSPHASQEHHQLEAKFSAHETVRDIPNPNYSKMPSFKSLQVVLKAGMSAAPGREQRPCVTNSWCLSSASGHSSLQLPCWQSQESPHQARVWLVGLCWFLFFCFLNLQTNRENWVCFKIKASEGMVV